jgi:hypothetical protein
MRSELVDLTDVAIEHETEKAILVTNLKGRKVWLPKSQVEIDEERVITMPLWLAREVELV